MIELNYEEMVKVFEFIVVRKAFDTTKSGDVERFYKEDKTEDAWRMFHTGFVYGFKERV